MALARDTFTDLGQQSLVNPYSANYTCTGSNLELVVCITGLGGDFITSVTYNGVAMTLVDKMNFTSTVWMYSYILIAPATGTHAVAINGSTTNTYNVFAASWTSAKQSGQPDAHTTATAASADHITKAMSTIADGSWVIFYVQDTVSGTGTTYTYTNLTQRQANDDGIFADSNGPVSPAGSFTGTVTVTGVTQDWAALILSISPLVVASGVKQLAALGAG